MNTQVYAYILVSAFSMLMVVTISVLLFYKKSLYLPFLLLFFFTGGIIAVEFLQLAGHVDSAISVGIIELILLLLPPIYGFAVKKHYHLVRDPGMITLAIMTGTSIVIFFLIPGSAVNIIAVSHLYLFVFIYMSVKTGHSVLYGRIFRVQYIVFGSMEIITFYMQHPVIPTAIFLGASISLVLFVSLLHRFRIAKILDQASTITELNKKMSHTISRLKISNEQYRKILMEKELELYQIARHASLAELTAGIAHELSQPLTGIKLIAQNMVDDINYEEFEKLQAVSELLKICSLVDKSTSIINHIRNFSKRTVSSMKPLEINKVLLDAIELIGPQLKKNGIDLVFVLDENVPKIMGDKISLEQLVINIILNAKDAVLKKKDVKQDFEGEIRITSSKTDTAVQVIIEDDGIGIPDIMIQKIWSPFYTTKKKDHGTGIGLSISSKIMKEHNVQVDVKSSPVGTSFIFLFPMINASVESITG
jgi:signal transduction histidine kinase